MQSCSRQDGTAWQRKVLSEFGRAGFVWPGGLRSGCRSGDQKAGRQAADGRGMGAGDRRKGQKKRRTEKTGCSFLSAGMFCQSVSGCAVAAHRQSWPSAGHGLPGTVLPGHLQEGARHIGGAVHPGQFRTADTACVEEEFGHGAEPLLDLARAVADVEELQLFVQGIEDVGAEIPPGEFRRVFRAGPFGVEAQIDRQELFLGRCLYVLNAPQPAAPTVRGRGARARCRG